VQSLCRDRSGNRQVEIVAGVAQSLNQSAGDMRRVLFSVLRRASKRKRKKEKKINYRYRHRYRYGHRHTGSRCSLRPRLFKVDADGGWRMWRCGCGGLVIPQSQSRNFFYGVDLNRSAGTQDLAYVFFFWRSPIKSADKDESFARLSGHFFFFYSRCTRSGPTPFVCLPAVLPSRYVYRGWIQFLLFD